ncbi:DUF5941 domain-containing protein [Actinomadura sp. 9N407]|uniref:DUF5941 domain-containing protein n=1 Tax=Actinomadura sp. 9N407 TaxID=3375154 RepID=UPI00379DE047
MSASEPMTGPERLRAYRDDGPVAWLLGRLAERRPSRLWPTPVFGTAAALLLTGVLLAASTGGRDVPALFVPLVAVLLAAAPACRSLSGRIDWLVPPGIRTIEYGYLAVLGFTQDVAAPLVYVLLAVLAYHHYDIVYRTRQGFRPPEWLFRAGLGWDGRMLVVALAGLSGLVPFAYAALAVYLGVLFVGESVAVWVRAGLMDGRDAGRAAERGGVTGDLEEEEA